MDGPALSLVVIRSANVERAVQFYRALGLSFNKEQHGDGPVHYASAVWPTVFEVYPLVGFVALEDSTEPSQDGRRVPR